MSGLFTKEYGLALAAATTLLSDIGTHVVLDGGRIPLRSRDDGALLDLIDPGLTLSISGSSSNSSSRRRNASLFKLKLMNPDGFRSVMAASSTLSIGIYTELIAFLDISVEVFDGRRIYYVKTGRRDDVPSTTANEYFRRYVNVLQPSAYICRALFITNIAPSAIKFAPNLSLFTFCNACQVSIFLEGESWPASGVRLILKLLQHGNNSTSKEEDAVLKALVLFIFTTWPDMTSTGDAVPMLLQYIIDGGGDGDGVGEMRPSPSLAAWTKSLILGQRDVNTSTKDLERILNMLEDKVPK